MKLGNFTLPYHYKADLFSIVYIPLWARQHQRLCFFFLLSFNICCPCSRLIDVKIIKKNFLLFPKSQFLFSSLICNINTWWWNYLLPPNLTRVWCCGDSVVAITVLIIRVVVLGLASLFCPPLSCPPSPCPLPPRCPALRNRSELRLLQEVCTLGSVGNGSNIF